MILQVTRAPRVRRRRGGLLTSIDLDDEPSLEAHEVDDERVHWMLASKLHLHQLS